MLQTDTSQSRFFDGLPVACYACDRSGAIIGFNLKAVELWGRVPDPTDRFTGAHRLYDAAGNPIVQDATPTAFVVRWGLANKNQELTIERPDGKRITVLSNVAPLLDEDGETVGALDVLQDITDRRWSEDARRVAERLRAAARLAAEVAQQMKPTLLSMADLLERLSSDETLSERAREYAELARQELSQFDKLAKHMAHLSGAA